MVDDIEGSKGSESRGVRVCRLELGRQNIRDLAFDDQAASLLVELGNRGTRKGEGSLKSQLPLGNLVLVVLRELSRGLASGVGVGCLMNRHNLRWDSNA